MENKRGFSSTIGFLLSMAAFSIGIGNLWKFPYIVGANGGGAFLLVYLLIVILVGIPGFLIELTLGRTSGLSPIKGMEKLEGKKTAVTPKKQKKSEPEPQLMNLSMFDAAADEITERLKKTDINTLTPIEALNLIYEWKKLL